MSDVIALMSMTLDGYVADRNDGVSEVFNGFTASRDVEVHTGGPPRPPGTPTPP